MACLSVQVVMVEIPVEVSLTLVLQCREQLLLHRLQEVKAHEKIMVIGECHRVGLFSHAAIEGSLVG